MAAAIQLPNLRESVRNQVWYPSAVPEIPPTEKDLADALRLYQEVYFVRREPHHSLAVTDSAY
jgi:hypothetical protein